jgi:hypothetical protein
MRALTQQVDLLQEELKTAAGALKQALIFLIKRIQAEMEPPLSDPKVFVSESTQGLPEYELVAGKDTLARVFVGAKQPVVLPVGEDGSKIP